MKKNTLGDERLFSLIRKRLSAAKPVAVRPQEGGGTGAVKKGVDLYALATVLLGGMVVFFILVIIVKSYQKWREAPVELSAFSDQSEPAGAANEVLLEVPAGIDAAEQGVRSEITLFAAPWEKEIPGESSGVPEFLEKYRLVGILLDGDPTVIVEDIENQQTFFLSEGRPAGKLAVRKILKEQVVLQYNGREIKLVP